MKNAAYFLLLFLSFSVYSQQRVIEITNVNTGKIKLFEENQRIKVRTLDGKKRIGLLHFSDNETLVVNKSSIKLDSIQSIQKQPRTFGTIKTIVLVAGLTVVGASLVAASKGNDAAFVLFTAGSGITIGSGLLEGINKSNTKRKCLFKIIEK